MRDDVFSASGRSALEVGEAAAGIVHDFANLIQAIILRGEFILARGALAENDSAKLEQLLNDSRIMGEILHMLLERGRASISSSTERVDMGAVLNNVAAGRGMDKVSLKKPPSDTVMARGDGLLLGELASLSLKALSKGAPPETSLSITSFMATHEEVEALSPPWLEPCPWAAVTITRNGKGGDFPIDEEFHLTHKGPEEIDLDILRIRGIIKLHSGFYRVQKEETSGGVLVFSYYIPDRKL